MFFTYVLYALPLALVWVAITNRVTVEGFIVGFVISLGVIWFSQPKVFKVKPSRVPGQFFALLIYVGQLFVDIILSGVDVSRRVLSPTMPLKPGIVAVKTGDKDKNPIIAALSSDVISLTPGELVVEIDDNHTLYVHSLDVDLTAANAERIQMRRLSLLYRIIGKE